MTNVLLYDFYGHVCLFTIHTKGEAISLETPRPTPHNSLPQVWHSFVENKGLLCILPEYPELELLNAASSGHDIRCFPNVCSHVLNS